MHQLNLTKDELSFLGLISLRWGLNYKFLSRENYIGLSMKMIPEKSSLDFCWKNSPKNAPKIFCKAHYFRPFIGVITQFIPGSGAQTFVAQILAQAFGSSNDVGKSCSKQYRLGRPAGDFLFPKFCARPWYMFLNCTRNIKFFNACCLFQLELTSKTHYTWKIYRVFHTVDGWTQSCTTWDVSNPVNHRIWSYQPQALTAGFLVVINSMLRYHLGWFPVNDREVEGSR